MDMFSIAGVDAPTPDTIDFSSEPAVQATPDPVKSCVSAYIDSFTCVGNETDKSVFDVVFSITESCQEPEYKYYTYKIVKRISFDTRSLLEMAKQTPTSLVESKETSSDYLLEHFKNIAGV